MASSVYATSAVVVPSARTPQPCHVALSNLDLLGNTYTKQVYYFKPRSAGIPFKEVAVELKRSLSHVLSYYYLLAGRIQVGDDGRYFVNCNDQGVPFHEASTGERLEDVTDCEIEEQLCPAEEFVTDGKFGPLIQIQVTRFACGSIALGYVVSEMVVDGFSGLEFIKSWSELHREVPLSNPPLFDLGNILKAKQSKQAAEMEVCRDYTASQVDSSGWLAVNYKKLSKGTYQRMVFTISHDKVGALVKEVEEGPFAYGRATAFEAMAALVWKCMTEARDLDDDWITKYVYSKSFRNDATRWVPVIPKGCFGNAVHISCLPARAGDIRAKHLSFAASLIHQDIRSTTMDSIKSTIDWMQVQLDKGLQLGFNCDFYKGTDVHCTSLYTFPVYDVDFGELLGKPVHYSLVVDAWFGDGVAFMLPNRNMGRNRDISIAMPQAHMERLLVNDTFTRFAVPQKK